MSIKNCSAFLFSASGGTSACKSQHFCSLWLAVPHTHRASQKRELRGGLTNCLARREAPLYLCHFWQTCLSFCSDCQQLKCHQIPRPSVPRLPYLLALRYFFLLVNIGNSITFCPLSQGQGELIACSLPRSCSYWWTATSLLSVICELLISPSASQCSPGSDFLADTVIANLHFWLLQVLWVKSSCFGRMSRALSWWETGLPGSLLFLCRDCCTSQLAP